MKKVLIALVALVSTTGVFAQKKVADVAKLDTETFDFGKVKQSVPATATFTVTNIGTEPLIIEQANPTCGCTISDYTKSPIAPGQTGTINATYNAAALGAIHKTLTVKFAGIDEIKSINLAGEVLEPTAFDAWAAENTKTKIKETDDKAKVKTEVKKSDGTTTKTKKKTRKPAVTTAAKS
jgi:hypothetical protein